MNKLNHIENPVEKDQETLDPSIIEFINNCMQEEESSSQLIAVLHKIQEHYGYLSRENLELVAKTMKIPTSKISGVAKTPLGLSFGLSLRSYILSTPASVIESKA